MAGGRSPPAPGSSAPGPPSEIRPNMFSKARRALPFGSRLSNESKGLKDCECDLLQEMAAHDHHHAERRLDGPKSSTETIGTAKHVEHTEVPPITKTNGGFMIFTVRLAGARAESNAKQGRKQRQSKKGKPASISPKH